MTDATAKFFGDLGELGDDPRLRTATGTLRFDIVNNGQVEYWVIAADHNGVRVSRRDAPEDCDCVARADKAQFERMTRGEENATAAMLRGAFSVEGALELILLLFQRLLPDAPRSSGTPDRLAARSTP